MELKERVVHSLYEHLKVARDDFADNTLFRFERKGVDYELTYDEFFNYVCGMTRGMIKLGLAGKKVMVIGETSLEWLATYFATIFSGGIAIPVDVALSKEQLSEFAKMSGAEAIAYSNTWASFIEENVDLFAGIEHFIRLVDDHFDHKTAKEYELEKYMRASQIAHTGNAHHNMEIPHHDPHKLSILLFTSGTTGSSKMVMLNQSNVASMLNGAYKILYLLKPEDVLLSVLPVHHTYELNCGILGPMLYGSSICINDSIRHVTKNMKKYRPTCMAVVPLYVETFYNSIMKNVRKQGIEKTFNTALKISSVAGKVKIDLHKQLFGKVLEAFGGRLSKLVCGGAALRPELVDIFKAMGIHISQGYGITECAPLISVIPFDVYNPKSCGVLMDSMQLFIDKENPSDEFGEIVVKGPNVMMGYYKNEQATREVLMSDGWFHTGDYGYIDKNNYIYITGRKKNIIVLQDGKNVFPEEIEEYLGSIPHIKESVVVGRAKDNDLAITALIYPDFEYTDSVGLKTKEEVYNAIREQVNATNRKLVGYKRIVAIEFMETEFEKTPSRKIKRFLYK